MDIDEFLDRELSDIGLPTDTNAKDSAIEFPQFADNFESSPLFQNIKAHLSNGNLEQAEQSYVQLWRVLSQQKLKWNKEMYEQLSVLSRQFSSALNYSYNEVKKKAEQIYGLISRAKAALREGRKDMPFKIYSEIEEINNSIPNVFFEEKKIIEGQIMDFYKELRSTTDNELIKRVNSLINETSQVIEKINIAIRSNDMVNSIVNYNKCVELYDQIPEGFLRQKNSIGMRLLDIYKTLSIYTEISNLQRQLAQAPSQEASKFERQIRQQAQLNLSSPANFSNDSLSQKSALLSAKKERAKKNIEKGFYNEASKNIKEALQLEPNDAEAKAIHAKIKTLQ